MTDPPRYTLDEARLEINKTECARSGHSYNIVLTARNNDPHQLLCTRCGRSWNIEGANHARTTSELVP